MTLRPEPSFSCQALKGWEGRAAQEGWDGGVNNVKRITQTNRWFHFSKNILCWSLPKIKRSIILPTNLDSFQRTNLNTNLKSESDIRLDIGCFEFPLLKSGQIWSKVKHANANHRKPNGVTRWKFSSTWDSVCASHVQKIIIGDEDEDDDDDNNHDSFSTTFTHYSKANSIRSHVAFINNFFSIAL